MSQSNEKTNKKMIIADAATGAADPTTIAATTNVGAADIGKILTSSGPVVKCVILRAGQASGVASTAVATAAAAAAAAAGDSKPETKLKASGDGTTSTARPILLDAIEELEMDTTPKKQMVQQILGGPWTFLGQYEEEGLMIMVRKELEGEDGEQQQLRINPHRLQPPFHQTQVRGDILLLKVAAVPEEEEEEDDDNGNGRNTESASVAATDGAVAQGGPPNDDFFLDYTKEEYIRFAQRTDIAAPVLSTLSGEDNDDDGGDDMEADEEADDEDDDEEEDDDDDDEDEEEDEEDDGARVGILNLLMGQVLQRFREENGRGPNSEEVLRIRSAVAEKLGMDMPSNQEEEDEKAEEEVKGTGSSSSSSQNNPSSFSLPGASKENNGDGEEKKVSSSGADTSTSRKRGTEETGGDSKPRENKRVKFIEVETVDEDDDSD